MMRIFKICILTNSAKQPTKFFLSLIFFNWFNGTEKYEPHLTFAYRVCFVYLLYKGMMQSNLVTIENEGF